MKQYKNELKNSSLKQDKFIYFINEIASDFGQSYVRPAIWLIVFSIIYTLLIYGYENNALYDSGILTDQRL